MTHFPLVTQLFSAKKCATQGMSTVVHKIILMVKNAQVIMYQGFAMDLNYKSHQGLDMNYQ